MAWQGVFWITGGIMVFGSAFYAIFGSGKQQPWGKRLMEVDATS